MSVVVDVNVNEWILGLEGHRPFPIVFAGSDVALDERAAVEYPQLEIFPTMGGYPPYLCFANFFGDQKVVFTSDLIKRAAVLYNSSSNPRVPTVFPLNWPSLYYPSQIAVGRVCLRRIEIKHNMHENTIKTTNQLTYVLNFRPLSTYSRVYLIDSNR